VSVNELKCRLVRLAVEERVEQHLEHGAWRRHVLEKRCARAELHVIRFAEDLERGETIDVNQGTTTCSVQEEVSQPVQCSLTLSRLYDEVVLGRPLRDTVYV